MVYRTILDFRGRVVTQNHSYSQFIRRHGSYKNEADQPAIGRQRLTGSGDGNAFRVLRRVTARGKSAVATADSPHPHLPGSAQWTVPGQSQSDRYFR